MAITDIAVSGKVFQDDGDPVAGATVQLIETGTSTVEATYDEGTGTGAAGQWAFTETSLDATYDVKITSGSSIRNILWSDEITAKGVDTASLKVRGVDGAAAPIYLFADRADQDIDVWRINAADGGTLTFDNRASGGSDSDLVAHMTITPNATVASSTVIIPGILDVNGSVDFDGTDVDIVSSGDIDLTSTNNNAAAIYLRENAGTSGTIKIHADQGTSVTEGAESINILSDAGGVGIRSTANLANAVNITVDGGTSSTMTLFNDLGTAATEGSASIQLLSDVGGINLKSGLNGANSILLTADGGTSETIVIHSDRGTGAGSIELLSDAGGIELDAGTDIILDAGGADIFLKDDGTLFGTFTNSSGELVIKSSASGTTAATFTGANVMFAGTVDATTDFTIGSTVITDDSIVMTPSTSDTVTIAGATHGILNVTTVDAAGTAADVNIDADGEIVIDAADAAGAIFKIAGTAQLSVIDGAILPTTDNDIDLGSDSYQFKDAYVNGTLEADAVTIGGTNVVTGSLITTLGTISAGVWEGTDVAVAHGGTGASSLTDGGVLLGSGTSAVTAMAVLADSEMIVGDGTTDPVAESGATLRTSIGVGTGDSPQFTDLTLTDDLILNSDSAVFSMGDDSGFSITHDGDVGATIAGSPITITAAEASTWSTSGGALTVNGTGGLNLQEGGATIVSISDARVLATSNTASVDLDATGAIQVNSSGGAISIGNDNVDQAVNLATAGTRTLNIGIDDGTDVTTIDVNGNITVKGVSPSIIIGDGGTEDTALIFDGPGSGGHVDWHLARDNTYSSFTIGTGQTIDHAGTNQRISFHASNMRPYATIMSGEHTDAGEAHIYGLGVGYDLTAGDGATGSLAHVAIGAHVGGSITTQDNSETIPVIASLYVDEPNISNTSGSDTITATASIYVETVASEGAASGGDDYAIFVDGGNVRFDGALMIGNPTGGMKTAGAVNAGAYYDDNSQLTDWVFEEYYAKPIQLTRS